MGWVGGDECARKELRGEKGQMGINWKDISLCVKRPDGGHPHAASRYAEGSVF